MRRSSVIRGDDDTAVGLVECVKNQLRNQTWTDFRLEFGVHLFDMSVVFRFCLFLRIVLAQLTAKATCGLSIQPVNQGKIPRY